MITKQEAKELSALSNEIIELHEIRNKEIFEFLKVNNFKSSVNDRLQLISSRTVFLRNKMNQK